MSLLTASDLAFGDFSHPDLLFRKVSFTINPGDRIGLVGPNGSGKTTLIRLLAGELDPNRGNLIRRQGLRTAHVPQETAAHDESLLEFVLTADPVLGPLRGEIVSLESQLDSLEHSIRYASLLSAYQTRGGYPFEARARPILRGLGFSDREESLAMADLSSGQRARAELARLLLVSADILLLDEPTNHLDVPATEWLEDYLSHLTTTYLVSSHDRIFLNRAVTRIFEIRRGQISVFEGNYQSYREQRSLRERQAWKSFEGQQKRIDTLEASHRRRMKLAGKVARTPAGVRANKDFYRHKAAKVARSARLLKARILREPPVKKPWTERPVPVLELDPITRTGDIALRVEGLSKSYPGKKLFQGLSFSVPRGEHWGIVGPNGSGKTTLLRIVLGEEKPDSGRVELGAHARLGYYAQEGENLDLHKSPVEICLEVHQDESWVRTILGCLRMRQQQALRPLEVMSAGERSKVALARLLLSGANVLLLDEATNHLDIEAREALEATLDQFPGTILFVSHDRCFMDTLADEIIKLSP